MNYADLISRLETATGPSRELDAEIALANGWTYEKKKDERGRGGDSKPYWRKPGITNWYTCEKNGPPLYTESIDATLTLVPKGYAISAFELWHDEPCMLTLMGTHLEKDGKYWHDYKDGKWHSKGITPAIALVIACLKARGG